jgi:hypothetical protein
VVTPYPFHKKYFEFGKYRLHWNTANLPGEKAYPESSKSARYLSAIAMIIAPRTGYYAPFDSNTVSLVEPNQNRRYVIALGQISHLRSARTSTGRVLQMERESVLLHLRQVGHAAKQAVQVQLPRSATGRQPTRKQPRCTGCYGCRWLPVRVPRRRTATPYVPELRFCPGKRVIHSTMHRI